MDLISKFDFKIFLINPQFLKFGVLNIKCNGNLNNQDEDIYFSLHDFLHLVGCTGKAIVNKAISI